MPNPINNLQLSGTDYTDAATIADEWFAIGGAFNIVNGNVFYAVQYRLDPESSGLGNSAWSNDVQLPPGSGTIPRGVVGVKFRNVSAAQPATIVSAAIATSHVPVLALNSVGSLASSMITGRVNSDGTIDAGSGFTVNKTGVGTYVISFTSPFTVAPVVVGNTQTGGNPYIVEATTVTASQATITTWNVGGATIDGAFNFLAVALV